MAHNKIALLLLCLSIVFTLVLGTDVCDSCNCFEYIENDYLVSCRGKKNHSLNIDLQMIEWPKYDGDERVIRAFFNKMSIKVLPK
jgi:hypothetical protein